MRQYDTTRLADQIDRLNPTDERGQAWSIITDIAGDAPDAVQTEAVRFWSRHYQGTGR